MPAEPEEAAEESEVLEMSEDEEAADSDCSFYRALPATMLEQFSEGQKLNDE